MTEPMWTNLILVTVICQGEFGDCKTSQVCVGKGVYNRTNTWELCVLLELGSNQHLKLKPLLNRHLSHRIHVWYGYLYIWFIFMATVGKYTLPGWYGSKGPSGCGAGWHWHLPLDFVFHLKGLAQPFPPQNKPANVP